jgi:hypothetical protein
MGEKLRAGVDSPLRHTTLALFHISYVGSDWELGRGLQNQLAGERAGCLRHCKISDLCGMVRAARLERARALRKLDRSFEAAAAADFATPGCC